MITLKTEDGSSGMLQVRCCHCKQSMKWNDAASQGWVADENGKPFEVYYCPQCLMLTTNKDCAKVGA